MTAKQAYIDYYIRDFDATVFGFRLQELQQTDTAHHDKLKPD
jgi:hypothetical protein